MTYKNLFAFASSMGLLISILNLFGFTFYLNEVISSGLSLTTEIDPRYYSAVYIALGCTLLALGGILWIQSNFSVKGAILIGVSVCAIFAGISRYHMYNPNSPVWIEGLLMLIYLTAIAGVVNLKLKPKNAAGTSIFLLLFLPLSGKAQSFIEADAQYSEDKLWPRFSTHIHVPSEGEVRFLTVAEFSYQEALLMQGITWETSLGELGFTAGAFMESAETEAELKEGPTMLGFGAMGIYVLEQNLFHILLEVGSGYNFHEFVPLYDIRTWYLIEGFSIGARAHYELGAGPILGYQLGEHWQLNAGGFVQEHHAPTYLVGLAYRIGEHNHH